MNNKGFTLIELMVVIAIIAVLMGILGSVGGIALGWLMAFGLQSVAETFVGQSLTFRITVNPALNGFIIGILHRSFHMWCPWRDSNARHRD